MRRLKDAIVELRRSELDFEKETHLLHLRCVTEENSLYLDLFNHGQIGESAFRRLMLKSSERIDSLRHEGDGSSPLSLAWWDKFREKSLAKLSRTPGFRRFVEPLRCQAMARDYELAWAQYQGGQRALKLLDELPLLESLDANLTEALRTRYQAWTEKLRQGLDLTAEQFPEFVAQLQKRLGQRFMIMSEMATIEERAEHGIIPHDVAELAMDDLHHRMHQMRAPMVPETQINPEELIRRIPLFKSLPEDQIPQIASCLKSFFVLEGEAMVEQGDRANSMYIIARGVARVCREADGQSRDLATLLAGDFFGEIALLSNENRTASVRAVTPCSLFELSREDLHALMDRHPAIRQSLEAAEARRRAELVDFGVNPTELLHNSSLFRDLPPPNSPPSPPE